VTEIGAYAFLNCKNFTGSLNIPSSVTSLGFAPFSGCYGFTSFTVAEENTSYCAVDSVIYNIGMTQLIECLPSKKNTFTIPSSVTSINLYAFQDCKLKGMLTIPNTITLIGSDAFDGASNCVIDIPDDCTNTNINSGAFNLVKGVWFTKTDPSTFLFSGNIGQTTYYIPEDDSAIDPQSSTSIKGLYKAKITSSDAKFRYYHLGMKCAQRTLASWPATQWGQSSVYCSTLYVNFPAVVPSGMKAFYGSEVPAGGAVVKLISFNNTDQNIVSESYPFVSNDVSTTRIPTKCPVVLLGNSVPDYADASNATAAGYTIYEADAEPTTERNVGILSGTLTSTNKSTVETGGSIVYTLGARNVTEGNDTRTLGFYPYTGTTLAAHKAYLLKTTAMPAKGLGFEVTFDGDSDTPTSISDMKNDEGFSENAPYYNLEGIKVNKPTKGGIYIHKGKKIVIY
jgi:hypothetical protein